MRTLKLVLKVDCIGGTTIMQACIELCEMAKRMGCIVEADFNGYLIRALPGDDRRSTSNNTGTSNFCERKGEHK